MAPDARKGDVVDGFELLDETGTARRLSEATSASALP
jgi:hypothetical protein